MTTSMSAYIPQWTLPQIPEGTYVLCERTKGGRLQLGVLVGRVDGAPQVAGLRTGGWTRPKPMAVVATASAADLVAIGDRPPAPKGIEARLNPELAPKSRADLISAAGLKHRGWTDHLIETYLGDPDVKKDNPHYRTAPPMRLYRLGRVRDAEATERWQAAHQLAASRRESAVRAASTKRSNTIARVEQALAEHPPKVPVMSREDLNRRALKSWREHALTRRNYDGGTPGPEHDDRLAVNYLRHECTDYEDHVASIYGFVGKEDALALIRDAIYEAIADAYPDLEAECSRQIESRW